MEGNGLNRRQRYAAVTKAAIVDGARKLFADRGFEETAVDDIARMSQVSKGAVYHHFRDKQDLFAEVYVAVSASVATAVGEALAQVIDGGPWDRIEAGAHAMIECYRHDPIARELGRQAMGVLGADRMKELDAALALPLIEALLSQARDAGELLPVNLEFAAQLAFRVLAEASVAVAYAQDPDTASPQVEVVVRRMLSGLRAPAVQARPPAEPADNVISIG